MCLRIIRILVIFITSLCVGDCAVSKKVPYLEDLAADLQLHKQHWRSDQKQCLETTIQIFRNVHNFTLWTSWVWDAMQIKPLGLLYGSQYHLGNFDQCLEPPWSLEEYPELQTQYCLVDIQIGGSKVNRKPGGFDPYNTANEYLLTPTKYNRKLTTITWGLCVPATCNTDSVKEIFNALLSRSQLAAVTSELQIKVDPACQAAGKPHQYTLGYYIFFVCLLSLTAMAVISSYVYDPSACTASNGKAISFMDVTRCFSLRENYKKLVKEEPGEIRILNGVRVLTSVVVVLIHHPLLMTSAYIMFNGNGLDKMLQTQFRWVTHLDLAVDIFFMMAGLLLTKSFVPKLGTKLENPLKQLFKRYIRLAPTFAVIVFFMSTVFWHTGSGPIWQRLALKEMNSCRKNWWLSLLMANNYINSSELCFVISWSILSDYHFMILGTALFHLYNKHKGLGLSVHYALFLASLVLPGVYTYIYGYPHLILSDIDGLKDVRNNEAFNTLYIASHMRMASYFIGMMFGYFISVYNPSHFRKIIPQSWSIAGTCLGVGLLLSILHLATQDRSPLEAALCSSLNRPLSALGVGIVVMCCLYGTVPILNSFLCWDLFRPLSRLTYGIYLVHSVINLRNIFSIRTPYFMDASKIITEALGVLYVSYLISFCLWMLVETPAINLYNLCVNPKRIASTKVIETKSLIMTSRRCNGAVKKDN